MVTPFGASVKVLHGCRQARAVRCRLKCHNERNPRPQLPSGDAGHSGGLPPQGARKAGTTSNQHGPTSGATHVLQWGAQRDGAMRVASDR